MTRTEASRPFIPSFICSAGSCLNAFTELKRVLVPNGVLLLAFHRGKETMHQDEMWGKTVNLDFHFFEREEVQQSLCRAGFDVLETSERAPYPDVEHPSYRVYIFARKT